MLLSKLLVPKNAGPAPPREPPFLGEGEAPTLAWQRKRELFARYMVALFVPWTTIPDALARANPELKPCPPALTEETLLRWLDQLQHKARQPTLWQEEDAEGMDGAEGAERNECESESEEGEGDVAHGRGTAQGGGEEEVEVEVAEEMEMEEEMEAEAEMEEEVEAAEQQMEAEAQADDEQDEAATSEALANDATYELPEGPMTIGKNRNAVLLPGGYHQMERTIARGRLWAMHQYTHALKVSVFSKLLLTQHRMENRKVWTEEEMEKAKAQMAPHDDQRAKKAARAIEDLRARAESRKLNVRRLEEATKVSAWVEGSLTTMGLDMPPLDDVVVGETMPPPESDGEPKTAIAGSGLLSTDSDMVEEVEKSVKVRPPFAEADGECDEEAQAFAAVAADGVNVRVPLEFRELDDDALEALVRSWKADCVKWEAAVKQAKEHGESPPDKPPPPMNHEQRVFCREMVDILHELKRRRLRWRRQHATKKGERQGYMEGFNRQLQHLLIGQAGAGKSEMLNCLRRVMVREHLGGMACSAFTGVAVTQLIDAYTLCKLTGLPGHAQTRQHQFGQPSEEQMGTFDRMVRGAANLSVLVIDEMSFIGSTFLHHLDIRLQALLECNLPFGGLLVIMTGDFHVSSPSGPDADPPALERTPAASPAQPQARLMVAPPSPQTPSHPTPPHPPHTATATGGRQAALQRIGAGLHRLPEQQDGQAIAKPEIWEHQPRQEGHRPISQVPAPSLAHQPALEGRRKVEEDPDRHAQLLCTSAGDQGLHQRSVKADRKGHGDCRVGRGSNRVPRARRGRRLHCGTSLSVCQATWTCPLSLAAAAVRTRGGMAHPGRDRCRLSW